MNYLNYPNLLFIVNSSKNIEVIETKKPNIISGLDVFLTFCSEIFLEEFADSSFFLFRRLEKGLITTKYI